MRALPVSLGVGAMIMVVGIALLSARPEAASTLRAATEFSTIGDDKERAIALFNEAGKVILNPRCVNCHPAGDRPRQGDDGHPHQPLVVRGMGGFGAIGMHCTTCHGPENFDPGRVPGHPAWHLAPIEMAWADKSLGEICEQIKDPKRNGGKNLDEIVHHMAEDSLVGWGWHPGVGRAPVPGTQQEFGVLIKAWVEAGADCPSP
jgi:hypothetical protein